MCDVFGVEAVELRSDRKSRSIHEPRMLAMWLARKYTRAPWSEIGEFFGRRSHSTVISAHRRVEKLIRTRAEIGVSHETCDVEEAIRRVEAACERREAADSRYSSPFAPPANYTVSSAVVAADSRAELVGANRDESVVDISQIAESGSAGRAAHDLGHVQRRPLDLADRRVSRRSRFGSGRSSRSCCSRCIGLFVRWTIESTMRESLRVATARRRCDLEAAMLKTWFHVQKSNAESLANNLDIRQMVYPLLEPPAATRKRRAADEALQMKLEKSLGPGADRPTDYAGYLVADKKKRIVAADAARS